MDDKTKDIKNSLEKANTYLTTLDLHIIDDNREEALLNLNKARQELYNALIAIEQDKVNNNA